MRVGYIYVASARVSGLRAFSGYIALSARESETCSDALLEECCCMNSGHSAEVMGIEFCKTFWIFSRAWVIVDVFEPKAFL